MGGKQDQRGLFRGNSHKYPLAGGVAAVAAVEHNFNLDIHYYVVIDWVGFVELIDAPLVLTGGPPGRDVFDLALMLGGASPATP